jgi:internalin A
MRRFILDLMKQFELCFSFPDNETHYSIPELLDKQEPLEAATFTSETCLRFQYHYPVLPEGLLPRFIVRTHVLSEGLWRWRTGVILAFEGCQALVKADGQDKKVFIAVTGPTAARRRLLAVIRADFERIHHDIRNLQPQEMVPLPDYPDVVILYQKLQVMEESGIRTFPEVVGDRVIDVDIHALLNGVELDSTRRRERTMDTPRQAVRLFYSYSHKDETLRNELETHLKLLQRQGLLETWHDRKIEAGAEWKQKIDDNLERADIILLLVSAGFIASDYCSEKEMGRALERHEKGEACVIPVIVRDVSWRIAPFAKLQALPKDGRAVARWRDRNTAWRNVSEGVERVIEEMHKKERP